MAIDSFTVEQAETEIAELRGQLSILEEYLGLASSTQIPEAPAEGCGFYALNGVASLINASGLTGGIPIGWDDGTVNTVTAASATDLSGIYTIPANDANVGTSYIMETWGNGTWGSTAQTLNILQQLGGSAFGAQPSIGSTQFSTSAAFRWGILYRVTCRATGVSGAFSGTLWGVASQTANNCLSQTGVNGSIAFCGGPSANFTADTTGSLSLKVQASWSSTTGAPTITCHGTAVTRKGF